MKNMIVTHKMNIDLVRWEDKKPIDVMQDDKYSRDLQFALKENGVPYTPPEGCTVLVRYGRKNGQQGAYDTMPDGTDAWSISGNVLTVRLAPAVCAVAGEVFLTVTLLYEKAELSCFTLRLKVHGRPDAVPEIGEYVNITAFLPQPETAVPGQFLQVEATDEQGRVTKVAASSAAGVSNHKLLTNRDAADQHPIASITGLAKALAEKVTEADVLSTVNSVLEEAKENGEFESIPSYVREEAERAAAVVQSHQKANTLTFIACSDSHYPYPGVHVYSDQIGESVTHCGQAMELMRDMVHVDFGTMLGDLIWDSGETPDQAMAAMRFVNGCLAGGFRGIPHFRTRGNHDALPSDSICLTDDQIFANIGIFNQGAVYDSANRFRGYCYRDFPDYKIRVVCINTSETLTGGFLVSDAQNTWLASALDLSGLGTGWVSILLSHHPLDWGGSNTNVMQTVKAASGILCAFHGHVHSYKVDTITGTDIKRIAIPNICFYRNNEYGRNSGAENSEGIEFGETTTYHKAADSGEDTAFCVVTIDPSARKIYADHYGAGYDRVITCGDAEAKTYALINHLTNVTTSNDATSILEGSAYSAVLTVAEGCAISSARVTMGGMDVTASVYSGGRISIASVTGDVVITVVAQAHVGNYTNLVPTSLASDGVSVYNGTGYKDGSYISDGVSYGTDAETVATGFIHYTVGQAIYIKGAEFRNMSHARMYFKNTITGSGVFSCTNPANGVFSDGSAGGVLAIETLGTNYYRITPTEAFTGFASDSAVGCSMVYRASLYGTGENLIITHDEPIE